MKKTKEIELRDKKNTPRPTQIDCIILANQELKIYEPEALIDEYGKHTQLLISIRDSYKKQKNAL